MFLKQGRASLKDMENWKIMNQSGVLKAKTMSRREP